MNNFGNNKRFEYFNKNYGRYLLIIKWIHIVRLDVSKAFLGLIEFGHKKVLNWLNMYLKIKFESKNVTCIKCVKCTKFMLMYKKCTKNHVLSITFVPSRSCAKCDNINEWILKKNLLTN